MKDDSYLIPAQAVETAIEIKKSRFFACIYHCKDSEDAFAIIEASKQQHPTARHHCWAFIAGPPKQTSAVRCSDDGEPSGTAGKPILNVLQHSHIGEIVCIVNRYYGGIKLGAGGLVRAYSQSTQAAIEQLKTEKRMLLATVALTFPFAHEASVRHFCQKHALTISHIEYSDDVKFRLEIQGQKIQALMQEANNLCKGTIQWFVLE